MGMSTERMSESSISEASGDSTLLGEEVDM